MHTILHVERSSFFQKIIRDILKPQGFDLKQASSVKDALEILAQNDVDLVMTGIELDDGKGQDLIKEMNLLGHQKPTIVITGSESLAMRQELFSLGVTDYLVKQDLTDERLIHYIRNIMVPDPLLAAMKDMKIVALDDSKIETQVIQTIFALHGLKNVVSYQHPRDLLATKLDQDLFIVDLVMPEFSGEEIVRAIREKNKEAIIVVASSINHTKTVAHVLDSGANDYIAKPFEAQLFMARIKSTVRTFLLYRDLKKKQLEVEHLARTDGLTGILNHRAILGVLEEGLAQKARDPSRILGVLLLDVDNFKSINDTHGHLAGDEVLQELTAHLARHLPAGAHIGRYGGEEFLLVYQGVPLDDIRRSSAVSLEELKKKPLGSKKLTVGYSAGLIIQGKESLTDLLNIADAALYEAKRSGKNRIIEAAT